jgi:hypothetical protein
MQKFEVKFELEALFKNDEIHRLIKDNIGF